MNNSDGSAATSPGYCPLNFRKKRLSARRLAQEAINEERHGSRARPPVPPAPSASACRPRCARSEEALSPRVLRRTLDELQAIVDPLVSEVEGGRRAQAVARLVCQRHARAAARPAGC